MVGKLASVKPTKEELEDAKRILAGGCKIQKAKMAGMVHWLKQNPDEKAASSRGPERQRYLEAYLVHTLRTKGGVKVTLNERVVSSLKQEKVDHFWWSSEKMDQEVGMKKGLAWRLSGKLVTRPGLITGSSEDHMIEFKVPVEWTSSGTSDQSNVAIKTENETGEGDVELLNGAAGNLSASSNDVPVKKEPLTEEEKQKLASDEMKATVHQSLKLFQEYVLECKILAGSITETKYSEGLQTDNSKHLAKLQRMVKILENVATGKPLNDTELPKTVETIAALKVEHGELASWAERFGCPFGTRAACKKRRTK